MEKNEDPAGNYVVCESLSRHVQVFLHLLRIDYLQFD